MNPEQPVNFQSINLVRDELIATIESSARDLELFVTSEQENAEALQHSIDGMQQISGILKVLELRGASMLADELYAVSTEISPGSGGKGFNKKMEVVSNTFFILTRYLEYLQQVKQAVPSLLVPHINALRKIRQEPALPESHFLTLALPVKFPLEPCVAVATGKSQLQAQTRRIRQMYQVGLMGLLREKQLPNSIALMRRALKRLYSFAGSEAPLARLWWLADIALEVFNANNMTALETRKFIFMRIDKIFRQVELAGAKAFSATAPKGLIKELVYLIALSQDKTDRVKALLKACKSPKLPYTEVELQKQYAALYGPSSHTINSLAGVLQTEIVSAKRTLENADITASNHIDDLDNFLSSLVNISEILSVVGLTAASGSLKEQIPVVQKWADSDGSISPAELTIVADTLLFLESTVQNLDNADLSGEVIGGSDALSQQRHIASHELGSAVDIVIEESLAGLSLTKRGLSSFSDSNYDVGHIKNISRTLSSIRGAMSLMGHMRVVAILENSVEFVEEILLQREPPAAIDEYLEIFADVIIAVEYYFDSATVGDEMDDAVLKIAEESLAALGFAVND